MLYPLLRLSVAHARRNAMRGAAQPVWLPPQFVTTSSRDGYKVVAALLQAG
jgi:hypothetical protein